MQIDKVEQVGPHVVVVFHVIFKTLHMHKHKQQHRVYISARPHNQLQSIVCKNTAAVAAQVSLARKSFRN